MDAVEPASVPSVRDAAEDRLMANAAPAAQPVALPADWRDFLALTKPRVMSLVVFTGLCGLLAAPIPLHPVLGFTAVLCIALGAGAAADVGALVSGSDNSISVGSFAGTHYTFLSGAGLLAVYSLGLGIPFLLAAAGVGTFLGFSGYFKRHLVTVERLMGVLLVLTGIMFLTGSMQTMAYWFLEQFPWLATIG